MKGEWKKSENRMVWRVCNFRFMDYWWRKAAWCLMETLIIVQCILLVFLCGFNCLVFSSQHCMLDNSVFEWCFCCFSSHQLGIALFMWGCCCGCGNVCNTQEDTCENVSYQLRALVIEGNQVTLKSKILFTAPADYQLWTFEL